MVVWVSTIVFWSRPTCILPKCAINLGPKVRYNMKLKKNHNHITRMNNRALYQIWLRWFWILGIFLVGVLVYKCSIPSKNLHGHSPFRNFETCACGMYTRSTSIICGPPYLTSFLYTKYMLKGDLLGFWIWIDWDFETWPMFETTP
jgi:hypothetical protein